MQGAVHVLIGLADGVASSKWAPRTTRRERGLAIDSLVVKAGFWSRPAFGQGRLLVRAGFWSGPDTVISVGRRSRSRSVADRRRAEVVADARCHLLLDRQVLEQELVALDVELQPTLGEGIGSHGEAIAQALLVVGRYPLGSRFAAGKRQDNRQDELSHAHDIASAKRSEEDSLSSAAASRLIYKRRSVAATRQLRARPNRPRLAADEQQAGMRLQLEPGRRRGSVRLFRRVAGDPRRDYFPLPM